MGTIGLPIRERRMKVDVLDVCSTLSMGNSEKLTADFIGKGNIWIDNTYNASVNQLARFVLCEAIFKTAPGQLSILGYDGDLSGVFAPFAALSAMSSDSDSRGL